MCGKWAMVMATSVAVLLGGLAVSPGVALASPGSITSLTVSNVKTSPSTQKKKTGPARRGNLRDNRNRGGLSASQCSYPPVSAPAVSLVPSTWNAKPGQRFTFAGQVLVNSCGLGGLSVGIFVSANPSGPFIYGGSTQTNRKGEYWFKMTQPDTRYYEVMSAATAAFNSATSNVVTVHKGN